MAGFFYHPWMLGLVHLVTLGWITFSIFGAFFFVAPLALRIDVPVRPMDRVAYALAVIGLTGMVAHFWIEEYAGMAWSAATITAGGLHATGRMIAAARHAPVAHAVRLHIALAGVNFWLAAGLGVLLAIHKATPFLPGFTLSNVFAHAHLAAIGWAVMMVVGVAYRLLPMVLPSKMPAGRAMYASAVLLEMGVLGLFAALLFQSGTALLWAALVAAGLGVFAAHVAWMLRNPARRPPAAPRFDFAVAYAGLAGLALAGAVTLGLAVLLLPPSAVRLQAAAAYAVLGLVGFLAQMVVAIEARIVPLAAWSYAYAHSGYTALPPSPHTVHARTWQAVGLAGWAGGVPLFAAGFAFESRPLCAAGATALCAAAIAGSVDFFGMLSRALRHARPAAHPLVH